MTNIANIFTKYSNKAYMVLCNNLISLIVFINVLLQISKCNGFHVLYKQLSNIPSKHSIKFDVLYSTRIHHEQTNLPNSNFIKLKLIEFKILNDIGTTGLYNYLFFNLFICFNFIFDQTHSSSWYQGKSKYVYMMFLILNREYFKWPCFYVFENEQSILLKNLIRYAKTILYFHRQLIFCLNSV